MDKKIRILIYALLFLVVVQINYAIPVPHGIDGNIYELDGITPVGEGIDFSVYDITRGEYIPGKTRGNGYYSVSLNGYNGDLIIIRTWNKYHSSNRTVILQGVMHNVDLLINMSMPQSPPIITSKPITQAIEDKPYVYDVEAEDENNDILTYSLLVSPYGMNIDSEKGIIEWVPDNDDVGYHDVIVEVSDNIFTVNQSFTVEVINVNDAPIIISGLIITAFEDQEYEYGVEATDVDNEILYYYLDEKPEGMNINLTTGLIRWLPENDDVGDNNVTARVSDGNLSTLQSFTINVVNANDEFIINSTPITTAIEDELYIYDVDAYDIDKDGVLVYSLVISPIGMIINSSTGLIEWTPTNEQVGNNSVIMQVSDGILYQNQSFIINVLNVNDPPNITSKPVTNARVFLRYEYKVEATDPENDKLEYSLLEKPFNMYINKKTGRILWVPLIRHIGNNTVIVAVSDGNLSTTQTFNITVYLRHDSPGSGVGVGSIKLGFSEDSEITEEMERIEEGVKEIIIEKPSSTIEEIKINGEINEKLKLEVKELQNKPGKIKGLDKKVYKYLEIITEEEIEQVNRVVIQFKVDKKWLEENEAEITDVVLNRYIENNWEEIPITYIDSKGDYVYYTAEINGFSYFAVSLKFIKEPTETITTGPKESHVISGIIFKNNEISQVEKGTKLEITNINTRETIKTKTGIGYNLGAYYAIIGGSDGDKIDISIQNGVTYSKTSIILEGDMKGVDLILNKGGLSAITGYAIAPFIQISKEGYMVIAISLAICLVYLGYKKIILK